MLFQMAEIFAKAYEEAHWWQRKKKAAALEGIYQTYRDIAGWEEV